MMKSENGNSESEDKSAHGNTPSDTGSRSSFGLCDWLLALLLVVATFIAYQPAWKGEPVFDDDDHLTPPELSSLTGLARIWTELGVVSQYYPIAHSAFWLQHKLWGYSMPGYHLVNIFLHAGCALLLQRILKQLAVPGAWLAAGIFALHPVMAESVAWISELKNTLSTLFYLGAALAYLKFDVTRRKGFYFLALMLFVFGLLSKAVVASLPAALLVVFWWKRGKLSWKQDAQPLLPFFLAGIVSGLFTAWVERKFIGAEGSAFDLTFVERCLIAGRVVWFYLGKLCWPENLIFIYPRWVVSQAVWWQYLFPVTALMFVVGLWALRKRWRGPLAAVLFFGGTLFPVMGFLNVYPFRYSFVADHYQYLASLGIITAISVGVVLLLSRWRLWGRLPGHVISALLLATLAVLTWRQSRIYTDVETLWQTTIAKNPACFVAHSNLGNYLLQKGQVDEAIQHCRKALELEPGYAEIHNNLGNALLEKGQVDEAVREYKKALELRPGLAAAHFNLGAIHLQSGQADAAMAYFQKAVELRPEFVKARNNLGSVLLEKGRVDEAIVHFQKALEMRPDDPDAHNNLGNAQLQKGRSDEAIGHYRKVLSILPDNALANYNLGYALFQSGRLDEASNHFQKALAAKSDFFQAQYFLGKISLQQRQADKAMVHFQKALEMQSNLVDAHNGLGDALLQTGRTQEALACWRAAQQLDPNNLDALSSLAWTLATCPEASIRNGSEAIKLAQRANQLSGGRDAMILRRLAAAYAEGGRFAEATNTAQRALEFAGRQTNSVLTEALQAEIKLYESGLPIRDPQTSP